MLRSPIEVGLLAAVRAAAERHNVVLVDRTHGSAVAAFEPTLGHLLIAHRDDADWEDFEEHGAEIGKGVEWSIWADVMIESYKIDFIVDTGYGRLAIECDGHDFHDRTKQQAAYDRSRDRWLLARGLSTARFTGSEIVHSAEKCAQEIYEILQIIDRRGFALAHGGFSANGKAYR